MIKKAYEMKKVKKYLDDNNIKYEAINESNKPLLVSDIDCIVIPCYAELVIGKWIEVQLRFRDEHVYLMAFYSQIFATKDKYSELTRIINYINRKLCYDSILLHSIVLDEESGDIYNGMLIRYETIDEFFYEVMDYILNYQKQLLENICMPLLNVECGNWEIDDSKSYISKIMENSK